MYQKTTIVGRVGSDADLKYAPSGTPVLNFSVATTRKFKVGDEQKEETTWWRVAVWQKIAEAIAPYVKKGDMILVEGTLTPGEGGGPRVWTGSDGVAKASYEIRADSVRLLGGKKKEEAPPEEDRI